MRNAVSWQFLLTFAANVYEKSVDTVNEIVMEIMASHFGHPSFGVLTICA